MSDWMWVIVGTVGPLVAFCLMFGIGILIGKLLGRRAAEYPTPAEALGDDICRHGVCPHECPSCRPPPAVGRARVVASDDLTWQVDLAKFYRDYDTYRTELRMPGERAS